MGKLIQSAALPYRFRADGTAEVLLITTRQARRWHIPKGRPAPGHTLATSAAKEAHEEAGVRGRIGERSIGAYTILKREGVTAEVFVFLMLVEAEDDEFEEKAERERRWVAATEAAMLLDEPVLCEICRVLATGGDERWSPAHRPSGYSTH